MFEKLTGYRAGCAAKWNWSTVFLNQGTTASCHRTDTDTVDHISIHNFHNTPLKLKTRQLMQQGQWPGHGCEYCKHIENSGGISDRMNSNSLFNGKKIPHELLVNTDAIHTTPTVLEINFTNLCNMSCIYCSEGWSSVWEQENIKFNDRIEQAPRLLKGAEYERILFEFFQWLDTNVEHLSDLHILGGEPFIMPEFDKTVEFLKTRKLPDLNLVVITNLKITRDKLTQHLSVLNSLLDNNAIGSVRIVASLDCWGPEQEYIRTGLSLQQWEDNFAFIVKNYRNIDINVHSTITGLSIKTTDSLIDKINYYRTLLDNNKNIIHSKNFVTGFSYLSPKIYPYGFFDSDFEKILTKITDSYELEEMKGYKLSIDNEPYNPALIEDLKRYLDKLDFRRNTNWRNYFSWLDEFN